MIQDFNLSFSEQRNTCEHTHRSHVDTLQTQTTVLLYLKLHHLYPTHSRIEPNETRAQTSLPEIIKGKRNHHRFYETKYPQTLSRVSPQNYRPYVYPSGARTISLKKIIHSKGIQERKGKGETKKKHVTCFAALNIYIGTTPKHLVSSVKPL